MALISSSDTSSSGCINFVVIPELDSGFLTVGAAEIVALACSAVACSAVEGLGLVEEFAGEYAGNVGFTGPMVPEELTLLIVGLKSGPTGADPLFNCDLTGPAVAVTGNKGLIGPL